MALSKAERDALPESDFAIPKTRQLPINDEVHTRLAWDMVDRTFGISTGEKAEARSRILARASELGIDTKSWNGKNLSIQGMSLALPTVLDHPNRLPFTGILCQVDQASDGPPGGATGKCVYMPKAVAEAALPSLLGMAIDSTVHLKGHDVKRKVGIITEASIVGNEIAISGFFYAADFPEETKAIQAQKESLGFSYECQAQVSEGKESYLTIQSCIFTGAAVLYKADAAYTSTSIAANKEPAMTNEEIKAFIMELKADNVALRTEVTALKQGTVLSAASVVDKVKPHADRLRAAADAMEKDGQGMHEKRGHVKHLRGIADRMESDAVMGKLPHILETENWFEASANPLAETVANLTTAVADLTAKAAIPAPERRTVPTVPTNLTAANELLVADAALKAAGRSTTDRLALMIEARMNQAK